MSAKHPPLDYELYRDDHDGSWQAWTPDEFGACIGIGPTQEAAREDAALALLATAEAIMANKEL